ncbi:cysteine hydrolase family protein [Streptococcus hyovaginalis]|uniref:cysteine hydrolase family protein n=1 Tax=Streptococcus hyovaginalis TaxID=149015 RepID=UPI000414C476|nr:cysteine hydrolase family protein [Streptococcus hyovaginalis]
MTQEALLIIDVQEAFDHVNWGQRNNLQAEDNMLKLISDFRSNSRPIIHIQHVSDNPDSLFYSSRFQAFKKGFEPLKSEPLFQKTVNSAFIGTTLEDYLHQNAISHLTIVGLTLPHCVSTTTRMAANLGFEVTLISDATASFPLKGPDGKIIEARDCHYYNLAALNDEFATIKNTADYLNHTKH